MLSLLLLATFVKSKDCGTDLICIVEEGVLKITGTGTSLYGYKENQQPFFRDERLEITSIQFPPTLTSISSYIFRDLPLLTAIEIPNGIENIQDGAFKDCKSLKTVTFKYGTESNPKEPPKIRSIGINAFANCKEIESFIIPENMWEVNNYAFYNCYKLKKIELRCNAHGNGQTKIHNFDMGIPERQLVEITSPLDYKFDTFGCRNVIKKGERGEFNTKTKVLKILGDGESTNAAEGTDTSIFKYCNNAQFIEFPAQMKTIDSFCFERFSIKSIDLTGFTVEENAFRGCSNLESVTVDFKSTIKNGAFAECTGLKSINLVGTGEVEGFAILSVFPGLATNQYSYSIFIDPAITGITLANPFDGVGSSVPENTCSIYYLGTSDFSAKAYSVGEGKTATSYHSGEKVFGTHATLTNKQVKAYGKIAYSYDSPTTTLTINGVGKIEDKADGSSPFTEASTAKTVVCGSGITTFCAYCFKGFEELTTITFPATLTKISAHAFEGCVGLTGNIAFPSNLMTIDDSAFKGCNVNDFNIVFDQYSVLARIGNSAFENCVGLGPLTLPFTVQTIGSNAFKGCTKNLKTVTVKESSQLTSIGASAFEGCKIATFTIPVTVNSLGADIFKGGQENMEIKYYGKNDLSASTFGTTVKVEVDYFNYKPDKLCGVFVTKKGFHEELSVAYIPETHVLQLGMTARLSETGAYPLEAGLPFATCESIKEIYIGPRINAISKEFAKNLGGVEKITFDPQTICQTICTSAFEGCAQLREVLLPTMVKTIEPMAFKDCNSLRSVTLSVVGFTRIRNSLEYRNKVAKDSFKGCTNIKIVKMLDPFRASISEIFPDSVTSIEKIIVGENLESFTTDGFKPCTALKCIIYFNDYEPEAVGEIPEKTKVFVKENYNHKFGNKEPIKVKVLSEDTFYNIDETTKTLNIDGFGPLPNEALLTEIKDKIEAVTIAEGITGIGANLFNGFSKLKTVNIPASVTDIDVNSFVGCSSLESIKYEGTKVFTGDLKIFVAGKEKEVKVTVPEGYQSEKFFQFSVTKGNAQPEGEGTPEDSKGGNNDGGGGLGGGAIAGIVIAVIVLVAGIGFCVYWFVLRRPSVANVEASEEKPKEKEDENKDEFYVPKP